MTLPNHPSSPAGMMRVDELTEPPVVGRFYLVPTAKELWLNRMDVWPILLPFHEDTEIIGFKFDHAHLDQRFLNGHQWRYAEGGLRSTETNVDGRPLSRYASDMYRQADHTRSRPAVIWRRRKCVREITIHAARTIPAYWLSNLELAYAGCRLKPGLICPHRGAHLGSMPIDREGNVVCPMHGLKWNVASGELVRA